MERRDQLPETYPLSRVPDAPAPVAPRVTDEPCCDDAKKASCCAPSAKASCCGPAETGAKGCC